ncbi:MAG: HAD-IA family hydrolase [Dehalobacterium sp.]
MSLVMFDYDGVIANSLDAHVKSFLAAFHENGFTKLNTPQDIINLYENNVYQSMAELGLSEERIDLILASYKIRQDKLLDQIGFFDHVAEILDQISLNHKIYIITSNMAEAVQTVLDKNDVIGVEAVMGSERSKSKVKKIRMAMALYPDLTPYYVGDTKGDIYEGKRAGTITVGAAWGWHGPEKLRESSPDHLIYQPDELVELLERAK